VPIRDITYPELLCEQQIINKGGVIHERRYEKRAYRLVYLCTNLLGSIISHRLDNILVMRIYLVCATGTRRTLNTVALSYH
jgi:hypothetical protein